MKLDTERQYRDALEKLEKWMEKNWNNPAPPHIEELIQAIVNYEDKHYPI